MTVVAYVLLAIAAVLTLLVALLVGDARHAAGSDAMGLVIVPLLLAPRWLSIATALALSARQSALRWISESRGVQAGVSVAWLALAGIASFASVIMAYGPHSAAFKPWAFVLAVGVPGMVIVGIAAVCTRGRAADGRLDRQWRVAAGVLSAVVAAGGVAMGRVAIEDERALRAAAAAATAESQRWHAEQRRKLESLSPDAPLRDWLPWLNVSIAEFREPALAAVRARPTLEEDLAQMLRGDEAPLALTVLWLWMPEPREALAGPAHDAIATLPAWADRELSAPPAPVPATAGEAGPHEFPPPLQADLWQVSQAAIVVADRYRGSGFDFVSPIRAFSETLERHALPEDQFGADPTYQPRAYLREWLKDKPASRPAPE